MELCQITNNKISEIFKATDNIKQIKDIDGIMLVYEKFNKKFDVPKNPKVGILDMHLDITKTS